MVLMLILFALQTVLADGGIITLLILIFSFIAWVVKQVNGEGENAPPVRRPPRPRKEPRRREDDIFIQDGQDRPARQKEPGGKKHANAKRRRPVDDDPGEGPRRNTVSAKEVGTGVSRSVAEHLRPGAMSASVERDLGRSVDASVQSHLGAFTSGAASPAAFRSRAAFRTLLKNKDQVRQAILLNEILSKPRALRKEST